MEIQLPPNDVEQILTGICVGMNKGNENFDIKQIAVRSLQNSLKFIKDLFSKKEISDFVMDLLINCCMVSNADVQ